MNSRRLTHFVFYLFVFSCAVPAWAQSSGSIEGVVKDASGGVLSNSAVEISNPVSGYHRETMTGSAGEFRFTNVPFNPYHFTAAAKGFSSYTQDVASHRCGPRTVRQAAAREPVVFA